MLAKRRCAVAVLLGTVSAVVNSSLDAAEPERPNVVLIMTDNHAPWTLGCYGNKDIRTPSIDRLGLTKNTLVIFTADQGLCGGHHGMWGMGDHSRPLHTFDETAHVPLIVSHPGSIPPGRKADLMVSNYDLMPSVLSYLGLADKMPDDPPRPGRDYSPVLRGEKKGSGVFCAKHPSGRSGKRLPTPFSWKRFRGQTRFSCFARWLVAVGSLHGPPFRIQCCSKHEKRV